MYRNMIVRSYIMWLEVRKHDDTLFEKVIIDKEICPDDGEITYVDGEVRCSKHNYLRTEEPPKAAPWL